MAGSCPALQRSDHLELVGDVSFITVKKAGFLKKRLLGPGPSGAQAYIDARPVNLTQESVWPAAGP